MLPTEIHATCVYQYGGPEELRYQTIPRPQISKKEVLIQVYAAGVVPADWKSREGIFKTPRTSQFPFIPGSAIAGIIREVGTEVTAFKPGDAVYGQALQGGYAEYTVASPNSLALKPAYLSFEDAAALPSTATTAWQAIFEIGKLQSGQHILIHGAAGGVGLFAVQFAKWKGAHVTATASTNNLEYVRSLGADTVIDYTTTPFEEVVHNLDLVFDTVGGKTQARSLQTIKRGGKLISIVEEPSQEQARIHNIEAVFFAGRTTNTLLDQIAKLFENETIKPAPKRVFSLPEARQAQETSQIGHGRGRIVLQIVHEPTE